MKRGFNFGRSHFFVLISATALLAFVQGPDAQAHARLLRANPTDQSETSAPPHRVELWFDELLESGFAMLEVFPASQLQSRQHTNLLSNAASLDAKDRTHLIAPLPPLPPGQYVVQWRVLSRDGHSAPGRLSFRIRGLE
jgi:methionine-rich copper-binding protein CopC